MWVKFVCVSNLELLYFDLKKFTWIFFRFNLPLSRYATRRGATGQLPIPKFSKTCLVVRHNNKLQSSCPPPTNISAGCGPAAERNHYRSPRRFDNAKHTLRDRVLVLGMRSNSAVSPNSYRRQMRPSLEAINESERFRLERRYSCVAAVWFAFGAVLRVTPHVTCGRRSCWAVDEKSDHRKKHWTGWQCWGIGRVAAFKNRWFFCNNGVARCCTASSPAVQRPAWACLAFLLKNVTARWRQWTKCSVCGIRIVHLNGIGHKNCFKPCLIPLLSNPAFLTGMEWVILPSCRFFYTWKHDLTHCILCILPY